MNVISIKIERNCNDYNFKNNEELNMGCRICRFG